MEHGELRSVYVLGENPAQSEADVTRARRGVRFQGKADMTRTGCHFRV